MTQDQVMAMARQILPIIGTMMTFLGVSAVSATRLVDLGLAIVGPVFVVGSAVWSFISNSRASIMASAAKPVAPGAPAPQIILPKEEASLAAALPENVTAK